MIKKRNKKKKRNRKIKNYYKGKTECRVKKFVFKTLEVQF